MSQHKEELINLYQTQLYGSNRHMKLVLDEAIRKLNANVEPKDVEEWVINCEKSWNTIPSKNDDYNIHFIIALICFGIIIFHFIGFDTIRDNGYMVMVRYLFFGIGVYNFGVGVTKLFKLKF